MNASVNILVSVRPGQKMGAAQLLVFKTLRCGFPRAQVNVFGNGLTPAEELPVRQAMDLAAGRHGQYVSLARTFHDRWIEELARRAAGPFWICDTDVVFFESMENERMKNGTVLAGRLEPEFYDPWTRTIHVERLHTCVMWVDGPRLRGEMGAWRKQFPSFLDEVQLNLIGRSFAPGRAEPRHGSTKFYDTCAGLWKAGIGTPFTAEQNGAFEHLHCGTYVNEIGRCKELKDLRKVHEAIYANPAAARGLQFAQGKFYKRQAVPQEAGNCRGLSSRPRGGRGGGGGRGKRQCHTIPE